MKFAKPKYVGDPVNAVKIFNEKEVDELMVLNIDASVQNKEPDYQAIRDLAVECRMPFCYGGGVKTLEQVEKVISLGVEKVALSSGAIENPDTVKRTAELVGSQSIVVVLDVKKTFGKYVLCTHNATRTTNLGAVDFAKYAEDLGAGEIVVNSIDRDGAMKGYDLDLIERVRSAVSLPMTVLGGAGSLGDIAELIRAFGVIGAAAGSLFVFKGIYRAVLINYPSRAQRDALAAQAKQAGS